MLNCRIKKIIFLLDNHFSERDYQRFGIELLKANGFEVLVWEVTPIINSEVYNNTSVPDPIEYNGYRIFSEISDIQNSISRLGNDCLFVVFANYCLNFYKIFRAISRKNLPYCCEVSGSSFPLLGDYLDPSLQQSELKELPLLSRILNKIARLNYKNFKEYIFRRIPYRLLRLRPADFIMAGAAKSNVYLYKIPQDTNTKILWIHYFDYDNYLAEMRNPASVDQTTGVFLDQYAAFHPDYISEDRSPIVQADEYYSHLRKFFDYLEKNFKVKIIIAAHPRSHYENSDYFGGRPVIRNKTCELVRRAGFVVAHLSYSMNYAVLFNKPILFLTSAAFEKSFEGPYINLMATILGKKPIFMDRPYTVDFEKEIIIDAAKYQEYKQNHIKMAGTEELPFWQVVANYIKSNY